MHFFTLTAISGFSIALAVVIGMIRFRQLHRSYHLFLAICMLALLNEALSYLMIRVYRTNAINANFYVWMEYLLLLIQFRIWGSFRKSRAMVWALIVLGTGIWVYDNLILHSLREFNSIFRIFSSFVLVFLAIGQLNWLLMTERKNLARHPRFLICLGMIIFFSYKATMEVFYAFKIDFSNAFYDNVFFLLTLVNLFVNLLYALAVLWIPAKQKFTLPF